MNQKKNIMNKRKKTIRNSTLPYWTIVLCAGSVIAFLVLCIVFVPRLARLAISTEPDLRWLGYEKTENEADNTPLPTETPDPASAHSIYYADLNEVQKEILLNEYAYLSDVRVSADDVWCAVGPYSSATGVASFTAAARIHPDKGTKEYFSPELRHNVLRNPIGNGEWLVYADVMNSGGGRMACMNVETGEIKELKTVHIGIPEPWIWKDEAFWTERTGTDRYKLFGCDLITGESVTIDMIEGPDAVSRICVSDGILLYVNSEGKLISLNLETNVKSVIETEEIVHDPSMNDSYIAFLSGYHGYDSKLVYIGKDGIKHVAAEGVISFALGSDFIAYGDMDKSYVFFPEDNLTYCITRGGEKALFESAGKDIVYWLDTDWHDKDVLECMHINEL